MSKDTPPAENPRAEQTHSSQDDCINPVVRQDDGGWDNLNRHRSQRSHLTESGAIQPNEGRRLIVSGYVTDQLSETAGCRLDNHDVLGIDAHGMIKVLQAAMGAR